MTSSEWLRQYRENHNLDWTNSYSCPLHHYAPRNSSNFHNQDASMLNLRDHWQVLLASNQMIYPKSQLLHSGFPQVHAADEHRRDKLFPNYQRPTTYGYGVATDFRDEPQPLLQYLKERSLYGKLKCSYIINLLIQAHNTIDAIVVDVRLNLMKVNQVCIMIARPSVISKMGVQGKFYRENLAEAVHICCMVV
ncbi:hypothetical protein KPL70_003576 [Citrus sinensis]|nr:hypothetical protein KPL70_003576 [Citrus sinensis]